MSIPGAATPESPRLVEVIGPAGVGKSTLIRDLMARISSPGRAVQLIGIDERHSLRVALMDLPTEMSAAWAIFRDLRPILHKGGRDVRRAVQLLSLTPDVVRKRYRAFDLAVLDEVGVFHFLQRFGLRATVSDLSLSRIGSSPWLERRLPDLLVICGADEEIRLRRRKDRRTQDDRRETTDPGIRARLAHNQPRVELEIARIARAHEESGRMRVVQLDLSTEASRSEGLDALIRVICDGLPQ